MARVFIGVGSNINPEANVEKAMNLLAESVRVVAVSTFYRTEAEGRGGQPPFCNGVVEVETEMPPGELKRSVLRRIEERLGRRRSEDKYAARTIDLDILICDDLAGTFDGLVIPDPQIAERPFLAIPLGELAPDLVLPGTGVPLREIAEAHIGQKMEPLREYTELLRRSIGRES